MIIAVYMVQRHLKKSTTSKTYSRSQNSAPDLRLHRKYFKIKFIIAKLDILSNQIQIYCQNHKNSIENVCAHGNDSIREIDMVQG